MKEWSGALVGYALVALVPPLHVWCLSEFWGEYARRVDRRACRCSCWDTVFKGPYESGVAGYKHVYFNATAQSFKMWAVTSLFALLAYESAKRLVALRRDRRLRSSMALLAVASSFPHYYAWWAAFNYYNDDFYSQWYRQLAFALTECAATCVVLRLADARERPTPLAIAALVAISATHAIVASSDQFVANVVLGKGERHQVVRDVGFMIPDLLQVVVPILCFGREIKDRLRNRPRTYFHNTLY